MIRIGRHYYIVQARLGVVRFLNANYYKSSFVIEYTELAYLIEHSEIPSWQVCETLDHCQILDYLRGK